mmetsp:Transcript_41833/g.63973  ORF Transcript_41833/g.63973 Transcript_41833/m.63973 type:complete len:297 (+) Transcript_41833:494-1384(+)|eukprot:CAMPEP_0170498472 /NCGR_PEP_ID=MMETSP0208-20121228/27891_1 /TAXON_ID=197538 /ORGANISM="Strombidium inclinatum, Strain S3" /LENGTH=296 /DNA_ID=CAMNT_0010775649 /DNA_START=421 /DNA_END=1311 /DNA_ORIENTATION=-
MKVGSKRVDFCRNDPIFNLNGPTNVEIPSAECFVCAKRLKGKPKYCGFCGNRACDKCMYKQLGFVGGCDLTKSLEIQAALHGFVLADPEDRAAIGFSISSHKPHSASVRNLKSSSAGKMSMSKGLVKSSSRPDFLGMSTTSNHPSIRGRACKVCDRKHLMLISYSKHQASMDTEQFSLVEAKTQALQREHEYSEKKALAKQIKMQHEKDWNDYVLTKQECKRTRADLQREESQIIDETAIKERQLAEAKAKIAQLRELIDNTTVQTNTVIAQINREREALTKTNQTIDKLQSFNKE